MNIFPQIIIIIIVINIISRNYLMILRDQKIDLLFIILLF